TRAYCNAKVHQQEIETNFEFDFVLENHWRGPDTQLDKLRQVRDWISQTLASPGIDQTLLLSTFREPGVLDRSCVEALLRRGQDFSAAIDAHLRALENFGPVDVRSWIGGPEAPLEQFREKLKRCAATADMAPVIARFEALRSEAAQHGLEPILEALTSNRISGDQCGAAFEFAVYSKVLDKQVRAVPLLSRFGRETYEGLRRRFGELDAAMMGLVAQEIAAELCGVRPPEGIGSGPVKNYTEASLLRHEAGKKKKHLPLRQLVTRAANALQTLKPCFLMSPLSV